MDTTSETSAGAARQTITAFDSRPYIVPENQKRRLYHIAEVAGCIGISAVLAIAGIVATYSPKPSWAFWPALVVASVLSVLAVLITMFCLLCCSIQFRVSLGKLSLRLTALAVRLSSFGTLETRAMEDLISVQRTNLAYAEHPSWRPVTVCMVEVWPLSDLLLNHDADIPAILRSLKDSLTEARLSLDHTVVDKSSFLSRALASAQDLTIEWIGNAVLLVWECPPHDALLEAENAFHLLLLDFIGTVQLSFSSRMATLCDYRIGNPALSRIGLRIALSSGQAWPQSFNEKAHRSHWVGTPIDEVIELVKEQITGVGIVSSLCLSPYLFMERYCNNEGKLKRIYLRSTSIELPCWIREGYGPIYFRRSKQSTNQQMRAMLDWMTEPYPPNYQKAPSLVADDIHFVFGLREHWEAKFASELTVRRGRRDVTDHQIGRIEDTIRKMDRILEGATVSASWTELGQSFHGLIAEFSDGNEGKDRRQFVERLYKATQPVYSAAEPDRKLVVKEHRQILSSIKEHDPERTRELVKRHLSTHYMRARDALLRAKE